MAESEVDAFSHFLLVHILFSTFQVSTKLKLQSDLNSKIDYRKSKFHLLFTILN